MNETNYEEYDDIEIIDSEEKINLSEYFSHLPNVAKPLLFNMKRTLQKIQNMLSTTPAFINTIRACVPEETFRALLTDEQKQQIASGALKMMTKKDGSLMATLINPKTKKIVSTVSLEKVNLSPELSQALTSYSTQMQMAQIAEQIQEVQVAVEEVRQGQEHDRLATAYSCQQKLLQALSIKNPKLKDMALLQIASNAEDSRNLLMQSQKANVVFIQNQPESFWGKLVSGANPEKINSRLEEMRENLYAVNLVSLTEAMAYQEMGETEVAQVSLQYYAKYIQQTYLDLPDFVQRLDMIDPLPECYWSNTLPDIEKKIQALPCNTNTLIGGNENGAEAM